ncbi:MAG: zinc ribbon domain-containing protein [Desulfobacteraceae bacterium]|nr:MAG: zinc ribbon domain-containing protein [Desulfobacteraceae bacterium]
MNGFKYMRKKMPIYTYRCEKCGTSFEKLFLSFEKAKEKMRCPECRAVVKRDYSKQRFFASSNPYARELSEDTEEYREMHYHEKKKDWEKAAKAAEGVSEFAKNKFLQKARQEKSEA